MKTATKNAENNVIEKEGGFRIFKRGKAKWEVFAGAEIVHTARTKKAAEEWISQQLDENAAKEKLLQQADAAKEKLLQQADPEKAPEPKPEKKKDKGGKKETKGNDTDKKGNGTKKAAAAKPKTESRAYSAGVAVKEFLDNAKEKEAPLDQLIIRANAIYVDQGGADNLRESKFYVPKTIDALRAMGMVEYGTRRKKRVLVKIIGE
jgi:hypothetical protein